MKLPPRKKTAWPPNNRKAMANAIWRCCGERYADGHSKTCYTGKRARGKDRS